MNYEQAQEHRIFNFVSGSHAYGTQVEDSDVDVRGVFIAPITSAFQIFTAGAIFNGQPRDLVETARAHLKNNLLDDALQVLDSVLNTSIGDIQLNVETVQCPDTDSELQELRKFMKLAAACNPNILEYLYVDDESIIHTTDAWNRIREARGLFLSKKARYTFSGYAHAQLKKIQTHRRFLKNPPTHKPTYEEYVIPPSYDISPNYTQAVLQVREMVADETVAIFENVKRYQEAVRDWGDYQTYLKTRNPRRMELEAKYGFDTKHAMHLIRLMRMSHELLKEGTLHVRRPDAEELLAIRQGAWTYEECLAEAQKLEQELEDLYKTSTLQQRPNEKAIAKLYTSVCEEHYGISLD